MSSVLDILNNEQLEAVKQVEGPVMVFAGAGTGKTKTLTSRVAYMVQECGIMPYSILAITFTNKATREMRERLEGILEENANFLNISTIHSLCVKILRQSIDKIGYDRHFEIVDDEDAGKIVSDIFKNHFVDRMQIKPRQALKLISDYKNGVGVMSNYIKDIYQEYDATLKHNNQLDFDDLLLKTEELFETCPNVLDYYQSQYKYILVDEFQDTNHVQYHIIKMLAEKTRNLFVVGDDDQSIYSFRGATIDNILNFTKDYPDAKVVKLLQNYRSHDCILKGANALISNNITREGKELFSNIPGDPDKDIKIMQASYYDLEINYVINEITHLVASGKYSYKDIAVLYRNNSLSLKFEEKLIHSGIPYNIFGGLSFFKRKEVKDLISYFRFLIDPVKMTHFRRIININPLGIGDKTLSKLESICNDMNLTIFDGIDYMHENTPSTKTQVLKEFKELFVDLREHLDKMELLPFFDYLLDKTGYLAKLEEDDLLDNTNRVDNAKEFKSILYQIEHDYRFTNYDKIDKIRISLDDILLDQSIENQNKPDAITLSTIHSVKGLEFEVVFLVAMEEGIFPNFKYSDENDEELEEERRCAYVGVTRAKSLLYMTCSQERIQYGSKVSNQVSRFLREFMQSGIGKKEEQSHENEGGFHVGGKVIHKFFGYGTIVDMDDQFLQILFEQDSSLKKINKTFKNMKAVEE